MFFITDTVFPAGKNRLESGVEFPLKNRVDSASAVD
jgi:hypothetical protein